MTIRHINDGYHVIERRLEGRSRQPSPRAVVSGRAGQERFVLLDLAGASPSSTVVTDTGETEESALAGVRATSKGPVTLAASIRSVRTDSMASATAGSAVTATDRIGVRWLVLASDLTLRRAASARPARVTRPALAPPAAARSPAA